MEQLTINQTTRVEQISYPSSPAEGALRLTCSVGIIDNNFREVYFATIYKGGDVIGSFRWNNGFSHTVTGNDKAAADTLLEQFQALFCSTYGVQVTEPVVMEEPTPPQNE